VGDFMETALVLGSIIVSTVTSLIMQNMKITAITNIVVSVFTFFLSSLLILKVSSTSFILYANNIFLIDAYSSVQLFIISIE